MVVALDIPLSILVAPCGLQGVTSSGGRCGIRTHGDPTGHNGFRDRPIRPLWQPSTAHPIDAFPTLFGTVELQIARVEGASVTASGP